ncbi:hypothetical protein [Salinibaculum salinum]|uniref:hypothetical protein n=1 Tax=Salinibaculum salinum TaxID=3131996 RepID=UPI0030EB996D
MSESVLVLDNSVLSSLFAAGWFDAPSFYRPEQLVLISDRIWNEEFSPYHDVESEPAWATIREADLEIVQTQALGQLSKPDWSCIALAEEIEGNPIVVTNDRALREVTMRRDIHAEWGTHFIIRTFKGCGITVSDYEEGVEMYLGDVTLPGEVAAEVRSTEK